MPRLMIHYLTDHVVSVVVGSERLAMTPEDHGWWSIEIEAPVHPVPYEYAVHTESGELLDSDRTPRSFDGQTAVVDRWMGHDPTGRARRSSVFSNVLARRYPTAPAPENRVTFRLLEPNLGPEATVVVVGETDGLGNWDPAEGVELHPGPYPYWLGSTQLDAGDYEYKYVIDTADFAEWEQGPDRHVRIPDDSLVRIDDEGLMHHPAWRGAGVAIPVFSLRTDRSTGVGQFTDLIPFVDWAADAGFTVLQILPVNDTRKTDDWDDSYPYDPVSVFALHPLYMDLEAVPESTGFREDIDALRQDSEPSGTVAYEDVIAAKLSILRSMFAARKADDPDLAEFVDAEWAWLGPYSAWQTLREIHGTADMSAWGDDVAYDPGRIDELVDGEHSEQMAFHWWVQFHLHRQLGDAVAHARERGVAVKGDLPIGVSPTSAEVWQHPEIFHLDGQAGAPPDDFAVRGQNWGFPTYDWSAMSANGYAWWRNRFSAMADSMDAYRIDHVLGFFRIWEVPTDALDGLLGHFRPCLPWSAAELHERLGEQSIARLLRPTIDAEILEQRFGDHATAVRRAFLDGDHDDMYFVAPIRTQRDVVDAIADGALDEIPPADLPSVQRGVLDMIGDVALLEIEGGYHPRISWQETETYRRLNAETRHQFDAMAIDFMHHRHAEMWERRGRRALAAVIDATNMLACGEDLGMVPAEVPGVMHDLGLLSLEIERMPKRLGAERADPTEAPYLSVVSPSTHDTSTLRMWWAEDRERSRRYWNEVFGQPDPAPETATPEIVEAMLWRHLESPAMLCIAPLTDWLGMDGALRVPDHEMAAERINEPADRHHRWRYRMHLTVAELSAASEFTARIRSMIDATLR